MPIHTLKKIAIALAVFIAAGIAVFFCVRPKAPVVPLPNPNGYDDLVAAGKMLQGECPDVKTASRDELLEYMTTNRLAFNRARLGLSRECLVPVEYSLDQSDKNLESLRAIKSIARAFGAEAKLTEIEGRFFDAGKIDLDGIQLGHSCSRGGLLIKYMVGIACHAIARNHLQTSVARLTPAEARQILAKLQELEALAEPFAKIAGRENAFSRHICTHSLLHGLFMVVQTVRTMGSDPFGNKNMLQKCEQKWNTEQSCVRQLQVALAARAFETEKGRKPKGFNDLVPEYLKEIPVDPSTGKPINAVFESTNGHE